MSSSSAVVRDVVDRLNALEQSGVLALQPREVQALVSAVLGVYERACERAGGEIPAASPDVAATTAIRLACALARSQNLTPFDFALWYSHTAPAAAAAGHE